MHNGELILVKERLERREARMQAKKSVEVDRCITIQLGVCKYKPRTPAATLWLWNRDALTHAVIIRFAEGHDDIQSVRRAALKKHHELLLVRHGRRGHGALQKRGHRAQANHRHSALFQEIAARKLEPAHAFAAFVTHGVLITFFEIPVRPAPIPRPRPDPPACADHRDWPAKLADYRVVSQASQPWASPLVRPEKLPPRARERFSHQPRNPYPVAKSHRCARRASCFPRAPGNNSAG